MSKLLLLAALLLPLAGGVALADEPAVPEVKVAFFGDQGIGADAEAVLELVVHEGADAVVHMGDFDYGGDPQGWDAQIDAILGPEFPYFASAGNHDEGDYYAPRGYQEVLEARLTRLGIPWEGDLGVQSSLHFRGILILLTAPGSYGDGDRVHAPFIRAALAADDSDWSISAWHKNMQRMQVGGKGDETGWGVYEESRRGGAIVATAHEHSYSRTHLLADVDLQLVASTDEPLLLAADDPATPEDEGRTFVFVSGLGGESIRNQERGGPWWASVYTSDQGARPGALFGVFNHGGDPHLARFYFKNVAGEIVDEFLVARSPAPGRPVLSIDDVSVPEGDSGSSEAVFRVALLSPDGGEVSVDYATAGGDATPGLDYEPVSGRLQFTAGSTEQTIRVPVLGDETEEADETIRVDLAGPVGAVLLRPSGVATLVDDDGPDPFALRVTTEGAGSVILDPPGGSYAPGTPVTLSAVPAPGHAFVGWSGDLSGTESHVSLVVDADRAVVARFVLLGATLQELRTGKSGGSSAVSTSAPLAAAAGDLYLAAVAVKPNVAVASVSGLGLAWSPVRTQCSARGQTRVEVWQARGNPTEEGTVRAQFSAIPRSAVLAVSRYSGVGALDPQRGRSANTLGVVGSCSGGSDGTSYALPLATAGEGSLLYLAAAARNRDHAPGPGFVERAQLFAGSGGDVSGISVADLRAGEPGPFTVEGRFDGLVDWAIVAFEIPRRLELAVAPSSGGAVALDPPGGAYERWTRVTLTATPQPGFSFAGWSGDLSGRDNPAPLVMDGDKQVGAAFAREFTLNVAPAAGGEIALDPPGGRYQLGTPVRLTAVPAPRHRFDRWSGDLAGAVSPATLVVDADKSVGAAFVAGHAVAVAATSGGSVELDPPGGIYDAGTAVALRAVPAPGHRFDAWSGDLAGAQNPASLVVDADKSVAAAFVAQHALRVAAASGGSVELDPPGGVYDAGTAVRLRAVPAPGRRFAGWSGDLAGAQNPATLVLDADRSVAAEFVAQYTLSVAASGGSIALDPPGGRYDAGTAVRLTAVSAPRSRFVGWSGDATGAQNPTSVVVDADKTVVAMFVPEFAVTVVPAVGGAVALDPPGGIYTPGTMLRITATPSPGYRFGGWTGALAGAPNPASLNVFGDRSVGASFVREFSVSVATAAGGAVALDPPGGTYLEGTRVTLGATPAPGYRFAGWSGDLSGAENPASVVVDANKSVAAAFAPELALTVAPSAGGSIALDPPGGRYGLGALVRLTALADPGHAFAGWSGDLSGMVNPASLVVDRDRSAGARFVALAESLQEIRTGKSGGGSAVATGTALAAAPDDLYLVAIATKPHVAVTGVSGLGLAWSPVRAQCSGRGQTGIAVWQARGRPTSDGVVTAALAAPVRNAVVAVSRYAGAGELDPARSRSANTVGVDGACSGGTDGVSYSLDFGTTAPGSLVYLAVAGRHRDHLPGAGWTERAQVANGSAGDVVSASLSDLRASAPGPLRADGRFDGEVDWAVVAIEIPLPPLGP